MKLAVISCIHGNIFALDAVLAHIEGQSVDRIFCVGDLVGYGPFPNQAIERIRRLNIPTCAGCWDEDIVEGLNACECSYPSVLAERRGKLAHEWTDREISPENREFLAQLPHSLRQDNLAFVHGSPNSPHEYLLPDMDAFVALERVFSTEADVLFCGHTHVPYVRTLDAGELKIRITQNHDQQGQTFTTPLKRIVNVGSVGEPRHGRPNATYCIYDTNTERVTLKEVSYDYQKTCAAIVEKGLPKIFAWRLAKGLEYAERADNATHICER